MLAIFFLASSSRCFSSNAFDTIVALKPGQFTATLMTSAQVSLLVTLKDVLVVGDMTQELEDLQ